MTFEVKTPILNSPFEEPQKHWYIRPGETPERKTAGGGRWSFSRVTRVRAGM